MAFYDDPTTAVMTAALYLGEDPQNPNLDKVRKALQQVKANSKLFWASANDWTKPLFNTKSNDGGGCNSGNYNDSGAGPCDGFRLIDSHPYAFGP